MAMIGVRRISRLETLDLVKRAQGGDKRAKTQLVRQFEPLVSKLAKRYTFQDNLVDHRDLRQEGRIGILKAIESYNPDRGAAFFTWVFFKVRGAMTQLRRREESKHPPYTLPVEEAHHIQDPSQNPVMTHDLNVIVALIRSLLTPQEFRMFRDRWLSDNPVTIRQLADRYGMTHYRAVRTLKDIKTRVQSLLEDKGFKDMIL